MIDARLAEHFGADLTAISRVQPDIAKIHSQTSEQERLSLYALARFGFSGQGAIYDIGCGAGGSSLALALGLKDRQDGTTSVVECFDEFGRYIMSSGKKLIEGNPDVTNGRELFDHLTKPAKEFVRAVKLDINTDLEPYSQGKSVEIAHIDAAKSPVLWTNIFKSIAPAVIPGATIWIFQDFERARLPWQVYGLCELLPFGEIIGGSYFGTIYFKFTKPISDEVYRRIVEDRFSLDEKIERIESVFEILEKDYKDIFKAKFEIDCIKRTAIAYVHSYGGDPQRAVDILDTIDPEYRASRFGAFFDQELRKRLGHR